MAGRRTPPTHSRFASQESCPLRLDEGNSSGILYFPLSTASRDALPGGQKKAEEPHSVCRVDVEPEGQNQPGSHIKHCGDSPLKYPVLFEQSLIVTSFPIQPRAQRNSKLPPPRFVTLYLPSLVSGMHSWQFVTLLSLQLTLYPSQEHPKMHIPEQPLPPQQPLICPHALRRVHFPVYSGPK